jgi:hypothetical protein
MTPVKNLASCGAASGPANFACQFLTPFEKRAGILSKIKKSGGLVFQDRLMAYWFGLYFSRHGRSFNRFGCISSPQPLNFVYRAFLATTTSRPFST